LPPARSFIQLYKAVAYIRKVNVQINGANRYCVDIAIVNAEIHACDDNESVFEALGISGNKIALLGSTTDVKKYLSPKTEVVDARGKIIVPGFIDSHTHFAHMGVRSKQLDLSNTLSRQEALERVRSFARGKKPGDWVIGWGWDESQWSDSQDFICKEELDSVAPGNPVILQRVDCHLSCVNTLALEILNLPVDTIGYEFAVGKPTGVLKEQAAELAGKVLEPSVEQYISGIQAATKIAHALGVTSIQDASVERTMLKAYRSLRQENRLDIRASLMLTTDYLDNLVKLGLKAGFGDEWLMLGPLKVFSDGSIGARTAALTEPYTDSPDELGLLVWQKEQLEEIVLKAHENDIQVAIHAIGDRAIDLVLSCFEKASLRKKQNLRHRIEHAEMLSLEQVRRMNKLGVIASMQPNFTGQWGLPDGLYDHRLGRKRTKLMNPLALVVGEGVKLVFGSDCMPFNPLYGIHWAVNAPYLLQRISIDQAFKAYTIRGAYSSFEEQKKGTIEIGKLADLVMLDGNPFKEPAGVLDMAVEMTILDGKVVYDG
jgi:predicted amidohydrolase YtcJ